MSVEIITGDCLDVLRGMDAGSVDAVVTDIPYGLGKRWKRRGHGNNGRSRLWVGECPSWDTEVPQSRLEAALSIAPKWIVWGSYNASLPASTGVLVWDKIQQTNRSEGEAAQTNTVPGVRFFRMSRIDAYVNRAEFRKEHPCEKPIALMRWCLSFLPEGCKVLDPFAGVGTTAVACVQTGRQCIAVEINPTYADLARRRVAKAQGQMFAESS